MPGSDPNIQRDDDRRREDEDDRRQRVRDQLERAAEQSDPAALARTRQHLDVLADALAAPGRQAAIGYDPADGGRMLVAPVREYRCREDAHETRVYVSPKAVKDQSGNVTAYHYPIADGPFCVYCGRLMVRVYRAGEHIEKVIG